MKREMAEAERWDVLGNNKLSSTQEIVADALKSWRLKLGYFSLFAALPAILASQAQNGRADEPMISQPKTAFRNSSADSMRNTCRSKPDFLRRRGTYLLSHQRRKYDLASAFTGSDDCPGTPIPAGVYTNAAPYTDTGDTTGANSTINNSGCDYWYYSQSYGPDQVYSFTLTARGTNPQIQVTTGSPNRSPYIYVLDGRLGSRCPAGTGIEVNNCRASSDWYGEQTVTINAQRMNQLPLNAPLHLFVDSVNGDAGPYTLRIQDVTILEGPRRPFDFDGDGRTDLAVWRPDEGRWYLSNSLGNTQIDWGLQGDRIVAGDYDGDGKADAAVFRPSNNRWYRVHSLDGTIHETEWGLPGDKTVPSDYDGDGKQDLAVWRPSEGRWYINTISATHVFEWGLNGDTPVPGDYDNDGKTDLAVFRNGQWWIRNPFTGTIRSAEWGLAGDIPVPADYDGDGQTDLAVFRPSEGRWYIQHSSTGQVHTYFWGISGDTPVPGDYDADGKADIAVFRRGNGVWYRLFSSNGGISVLQWGIQGDVPVPTQFVD